MTVAVHSGGTKGLTGIGVHVGGVLKNVSDGWIRASGALKQFYAAALARLSTETVLGRANSAVTARVGTSAVTATMDGAVGDVSYAWARTAADAHPWTIDAPTSATTTFSTDAGQGEQWSATFTCTMTDQAGQSVTTAAVTADAANIYYGGGYSGSAPPAPGSYYP